MYKIIYSLLILAFIACNSNDQKGAQSKDAQSDNKAKTVSHSWSKADELEFLDGCIAQSETQLGKVKSEKLCMCILRQLQEKNPNNDSVKSEEISRDTAQTAAMRGNCTEE